MKLTNYSDKIDQIQQILNTEYFDDEQRCELIKRILNPYIFPKTNPMAKYSIQEIKEQIESHSGISFKDINRDTRKLEIIMIRQMAHFKARNLTSSPLEEIGIWFGKRDHASVIHSCNSIQNYLDTDRSFKEKHESFLLV